MRRLVHLRDDPTDEGEWEPLPFRFERLADEQVLLTNMVGEHLIVTDRHLDALVSRRPLDRSLYRRLCSRHIVRPSGDPLSIELLAMKTRTRLRRLADFTSLHMFVVTLRCEHTCEYCQVSRQGSAKTQYDMSEATADRALDLTFRSPAPAIKIEFQGGEPLLNFDLVRYIVERSPPTKRGSPEVARLRHRVQPCAARRRRHRLLSTARRSLLASLDGPAWLHNRNRPTARRR